jgi:hypothetical protein
VSGERQLITVVDEIVRGNRGGDAAISGVLRREIECFRNKTRDQAVWWNSAAWCDGVGRDTQAGERLGELAAWLDRPRHPAGAEWRLISRNDVFERGKVSDLDLFLATMVWGFGDRGYGWDRTGKILRAATDRYGDISRVLEGLRDAWQTGSAFAIASAWSRTGGAKVHGLDTAFASKLAYFACYDVQKGSGPLIADNNTAWAVFVLGGIEGSTKTSQGYREYVQWSAQRAEELGCRSDEVERALFVLGPDVKQIYRRLEE